MNRFFKISALLVLAVSFWSFPFLSSGQDLENKNLFGFFGSDEPKEDPPAPEAENNPSGLLDLFTQPDSEDKTESILESEVGNNSPSVVESKTMVQVPVALSKKHLMLPISTILSIVFEVFRKTRKTFYDREPL
mgnify:CR=1 FL=1